MRFQVFTSVSNREDVWGLLHTASTIQLIGLENEDGLPTYKLYGIPSNVQKYQSKHSSHVICKWPCNFEWFKEQRRLSIICSRILFAHIVKLLSLIFTVIINAWLLIKFIIRINLYYNTKKNFGICMDREKITYGKFSAGTILGNMENITIFKSRSASISIWRNIKI